jgi:starch phosphorylase
VEAGFDRFSPELVRQYLSEYARQLLGISVDDLLALGRRNPGDATELFNMAYLAIRGSGWVNGVSRLHAEVSRRLFQPLFPGLPASEVPVSHVTNGIHVPTWDGREADRLWTDLCGRRPWRGDQAGLEEPMRSAADERIWRMRATGRATPVDYARHRRSRRKPRTERRGCGRSACRRSWIPMR